MNDDMIPWSTTESGLGSGSFSKNDLSALQRSQQVQQLQLYGVERAPRDSCRSASCAVRPAGVSAAPATSTSTSAQPATSTQPATSFRWSEQYRASRLVDGGVSPEQLRQPTLPLAMLSLLIVTAIIVAVGAIMALVLNHERVNRVLMVIILVLSIAAVIGFAAAYDAVNQYQ